MRPPFGVQTLAQLTATGIDRSTVQRRGRYTRLLPAIYATEQVTTLARCFAVTLWQPRAVLSHRTAAWLWRLTDEPDVVEATVPRAVSVGAQAPSWLRLYRRNLDRDARSSAWGMPVVTDARALLDCVAVLEGEEADRLVDAALDRTISRRAVEQRCARDAGTHGAPAARRQLREAATLADSEPERLLGRALARRGYRLPANTVRVVGYWPDLVDVRSRTLIEVDGLGPHSEPPTFRRDRRRQNALIAERWYVLRYAGADVMADVEGIADEIVSVLRRRRANRRG
ncbi:DUF559 domain-containing protein [Rhodococcus sp. D2-41]|uniref:Endonuclease domain-containing protein n=1 Tax=Speluncibacter jeojiensis TaxID=2710754 RepID=A0A9X4M339_9ACTN|nr:DUF559 domain-containing protein [Rhodococcus sp. D2-41]MDG3012673.1 DUF559 domain-containing protein [Rhodococcus sp. D2-41]MDG3015222.1 endonuclease domain-containing protein [Corynebacteriales bacterium D3-21]